MTAARWQLLAILGVALASRSCSLWRPHQETDERIYRALSANLGQGRYSLRGTELLKELEPKDYDRPLFHHPPLFALVITPLRLVGPNAPVLVSWLGLLLCLVAIYLVLERRCRGPGETTAPVLACLLAAFDPVLSLVSTRIWMDALLCGLVAASYAALDAAVVTWRTRWTVAAGVLLGLACLTKAAALFLLPFWLCAYLLHRRDGVALKRGALLAGIVAVAVAPWFLWFTRTYGTLLPSGLGTKGWDLTKRPFLALIAHRPTYFYWAQLIHVYPGLLVAFLVHLGRRGRAAAASDRPLLLWTVWLVGGLAAITLMSHIGQSYQMRFLVYVVPTFYLVLGTALRFAGPAERPFLAVTWAYTAATGGLALYSRSDEVFSLIDLLRGAPLL